MVEVTLGSRIDLSSQLFRVLIAKFSHVQRHVHAHLCESILYLIIRKFDVIDEFVCNFQQSFFGPVGEPIKRTTIDEGRKLSASHSQQLSHRTHTKNDM
jgi:hypothetical protein